MFYDVVSNSGYGSGEKFDVCLKIISSYLFYLKAFYSWGGGGERRGIVGVMVPLCYFLFCYFLYFLFLLLFLISLLTRIEFQKLCKGEIIGLSKNKTTISGTFP